MNVWMFMSTMRYNSPTSILSSNIFQGRYPRPQLKRESGMEGEDGRGSKEGSLRHRYRGVED